MMFALFRRRRPEVGADIVTGTAELRALLDGYYRAADEVDRMRVVTSFRPPGAPRWIRVPALRWVVRLLFVRHVHRCVAALKAGVVRRGGAGVDVELKKQDIEMLDQFDQSLPRNPRPALMWSLCLVLLLLATVLISTWNGYSDSWMLVDLARAAVKLDGNAAANAISRQAEWGSGHHVAVWRTVVGSALEVSMAAALLLLLLVVPAFGVYLRLRRQFSAVEDNALAVTGSRAATEVDIDILAWALLLPMFAIVLGSAIRTALGSLGRVRVWSPSVWTLAIVWGLAVLILAGVIILSCWELWARHRERRSQVRLRRSRIQRFGRGVRYVLSLPIMLAVAVWIFSGSSPLLGSGPEEQDLLVAAAPPPIPDGTYVGTINRDISFMVTGIEQDVQCTDPHNRTIEAQQYLRFTIETWSSSDEFVDPAESRYLTLNHWSVLGQDGTPSATNLYMHPTCGRGLDAVKTPLAPGEHTVTDVVVSAPADDAVVLQLVVRSHPSIWRWKIPPVTKPAAQQQQR